jgi:hypothetical protein
MKKFGILAVAGLWLGVAGVASAQGTAAQCQTTQTHLCLSLDNAVLGTSVGDLAIATKNTAPVVIGADVTDTKGDIAVSPSNVSFPTAQFSLMGIAGTAQISLVNTATGVINPLTGQEVLNANFQATVNLPSLGATCTITTGTQTYSTDNTNIYPGKRFGAGSTGVTGALSGGWTSLSVPQACGLIGGALSGPGGLWVSAGITPPVLGLSASKAKATAGKSVTVKATVKDTGGVAAQNVKLCAAAPKALRLHGSACDTIASVPAGGSVTERFTFKSSKKAKGSLAVKFSATAPNIPINLTTTVKATTAVKVAAAPKKH